MSNHRNCIKCSKPIVLSPSAKERASKFGKTPDYYLKLFTVCSHCQINSWYEGIQK